MPRPRKMRCVSGFPPVSAFGPIDTPPSGEIFLSVEGMEAIRLSDADGMDQDTAAGLMGISRQTYGRILAEARNIVAHALMTGKILRVAGGNYEVRGHHGRRHQRGCCRKAAGLPPDVPE